MSPAHQSENDKARQVRALLHLGFSIQTLIDALPGVVTVERRDKFRTFHPETILLPPRSNRALDNLDSTTPAVTPSATE